ncbi:HNH endonuclease [Paenibacillus pinisoli]|uniref:HNH endonuclease n=2 Tax=Paenibacillus pinisoli TaxID=1276110 RepID=A0A3A6Q7G6_9BACL|nr:HNH endonuclease [Paenibacillus pinisoli]
MYPDELIPTWGVTPGKNEVNRNKWDRIDSGDVTLFSANGHIFSSGVVTVKLHNRELAEQLWGFNNAGETWEYIYFLDEIQQHQIPYLQFNQIAGYADNFIIQGFSVLTSERSERILEAFDLKSEVYLPDVSEEEYQNEVIRITAADDLDIAHSGTRRKEQPFLRRQLFKNRKHGHCGICGKMYPVNLLIAAHIKNRSKCTQEEKLDYKHIVMPMCKFGCDDLYEKGYIFIQNGAVRRNMRKMATPDLTNKLVELEGLICGHWNEGTQPYFEWHADIHNKVTI